MKLRTLSATDVFQKFSKYSSTSMTDKPSWCPTAAAVVVFPQPGLPIRNTHFWNRKRCQWPWNTHTHSFNGLCPRLPAWAGTSDRQWHQLGHMQVCTSLQTDNHTSTPPFSFLQARCHSCRPTKALTGNTHTGAYRQVNAWQLVN